MCMEREREGRNRYLQQEWLRDLRLGDGALQGGRPWSAAPAPDVARRRVCHDVSGHVQCNATQL